ncbi:hypothetical protein MLP_45020 [Microlunatus phosphovorus NM-1]|uniref:Uncharacterized protein n=1 Tax=Microlunatus phosphovorus (strain ATCC 700054 / DSM 10555 / JCM 9379 / NBRC 101784 / NCIMB 13414 / VKM Ac-1990 / NM-1) TaxID=1032480 RepID=F5XTR7_MICPN|nr:hypothetical protein MLP_45020 [Microlunatus phosphovorus NM-1]
MAWDQTVNRTGWLGLGQLGRMQLWGRVNQQTLADRWSDQTTALLGAGANLSAGTRYRLFSYRRGRCTNPPAPRSRFWSLVPL